VLFGCLDEITLQFACASRGTPSAKRREILQRDGLISPNTTQDEIDALWERDLKKLVFEQSARNYIALRKAILLTPAGAIVLPRWETATQNYAAQFDDATPGTALPRQTARIRQAAATMLNAFDKEFGKDLASLATGKNQPPQENQMMTQAAMLANLRGRFSPAAALALEMGGYMLDKAGFMPPQEIAFVI
jgi:hypothetical protein